MAVQRTVRVDLAAVEVKTSEGEFIEYKLTVLGARGAFALVDTKGRVIMKDTDWPTPQHEYTKTWPQADCPADGDTTHTLSISFAAAVQYTYLARIMKDVNTQLQVFKDIDFRSNTPTDKAFSAHRIFLA